MNGEREAELATLHARLGGCRLCLDAGYDVFPRAIFSGGIGARIMVIGQAPGITEKEAGRPFNAGSGNRLFTWLAEAGIEQNWFRSTQYMSSVTKCYPGRSPSGSGDRVPSRAEQGLCRPYLDAEIALINPALMLPVGRLAISLFYPPDQSMVKAGTRAEKVDKDCPKGIDRPSSGRQSIPLEQIIGTETQVDGCWIVPLPHPSGASRWHQVQANRQKVQQAVGLIQEHLKDLGYI